MKICLLYHSLPTMLIVYEEWPGFNVRFWNWRGVYFITKIKHIFATKSGYNYWRCGAFRGMRKVTHTHIDHVHCSSAQYALRHLFPPYKPSHHQSVMGEWCINMVGCDTCQIKLLLGEMKKI